MNNLRSISRGLVTWLTFVAAQSASLAAPAPSFSPKEIPEPLKQWETWATWNDEHRLCPNSYSNAGKHLCFWPSRLGIQAERAGGKFDLVVTTFHETWVPLPGNQDVWPYDVRVNGAPVAVVEHEGDPAVRLPAGTVRLEGAFRWSEIPQRIHLPHQIGLLVLAIEGQPVEAPVWDTAGFLWLKRDGSTEEADKNFLEVKLYGSLEDGIPLWLHVEVELTVSGKSREEEIGTILPEGWKLASVEGPIPVAIDETGKMKAQVRAGTWTVRADAFRFDNPKEVRYAPGAKVAAGEQLLAFQAQPDFRTVEITGAPSIDASQTRLPEKWRGLPVYRWDTTTTFRIEERLRGMGDQKPAGLTITRELWLDENGRGLTFRDRISGAMQQVWRLDAAPGQDLGSVRSGGQGQLITLNPQNEAPGVEIRTRNLNLEATGRMARAPALSATGWRADADAVNITLNLPPGWRLFALFGADWVRGDWLTEWTLLDLFLLLVFGLAVFRLWGWWAGLLAFVAFGLSYHESAAPRYLWLILLVPLALQRVVPEGRGRRVLAAGKWIIITLFVLVLVPFIAQQVQKVLYPQLETGFGGRATFYSGATYQDETVSAEAAPDMADSSGSTERIRRKLERIIIPKLEFRDATIREAVDFLEKKSVELDTDPGPKGVNIVMKLESEGPLEAPRAIRLEAPGIPGLDPVPASPAPAPAFGSPADARITVSLTNIPLIEALRYVTGLANLKFKIEPHAVSIVPLSEPTDVLVTKEWKIPPDMIPRMPAGDAGGVAPADATRGGSGIADRESAKNWLTAQGVTFNGSASAVFIVRNGRLIVRNTQDQLDVIDTVISTGGMGAPAGALSAPAFAVPGAPAGVSRSNLAYDEKARIQTGPGVPEWRWRAATFGWNGPVSATQQVKPVLISLRLERVLTALRIVLLLLLAAVLLRARRLGGTVFRAGGKTAALLLVAFTVANASAQTPIPDHTTIEQLRERLLKVPDAYPAADISSVTLTLSERKITIDAEIHATIRTGVPLPGRLPAWSPVTILVDDKPDVAMRRDDGYLWIVLEAGVHRVKVEGSLANLTEWEWTYLLKPRQVKIEAPDWNVTGVKPTGVPEAQVLFARKQKAAPGTAIYELQEVQTIATVDRQLELGLIWQVRSTVTRLSARGKPVSLRLPLLPGESILTPGAIVKDGFIEVRLGAQQQTFTYESSLPAANELKLTTRAEDTWVERWSLVASPVWNVSFKGLAPVFQPRSAELVPEWHPWPGESVAITVSRPKAIAGATITVNHATHEIALGKRQRTSKLELSLRCSLGEDFLVELPAGAEVTSLALDGSAIPARKDGNKLIVPVHPGEQTVAIAWKTNTALEFRAQTDEVRLPVESANVQTNMIVPEDRWVLWVDGPRRGPALRFWGILICSLLAAVALGRVTGSPLRTIEWMLLVIGLTQVPLPAALVVVGWFFFLAWRGGEGFQRLARWLYNLLQVLLILLTIAALGTLIAAVGEGLLGTPEMFIMGNGSTRTSLHWFQARSENLLPRPGLLSISIWWYRLFMLVWALWLAASLIRWLRRGWEVFSSGGAFRSKPAKPATPPPPLPTQPSAK